MNLGAQIKKYRTEFSFSQEELAEKLFVSRQSISNWENDRTYPDIKSLLLLSEVFSVSLDELVKGDIEMMKTEMNEQDIAKFEKDGIILAIYFIGILILPVPLAKFLGWWGLGIYLIYFAVVMCHAFRIEKQKKKFDIQTYREIVAFTEGKSLTEIEKARESGKRVYQKILCAIGAGIVAAVVSAIIIWILG